MEEIGEILKETLQKDECAIIANTMLKLLRTGNITLKEYLKRCAYWGVKTLGDLYFRSLPSESLEVIEYEQLSNYKKHKLTQEFFADHPGIMRYYEERDKIIRKNNDNLWRIKTYKKYTPESDIKSHEELDKMIMDFKTKMAGY